MVKNLLRKIGRTLRASETPNPFKQEISLIPSIVKRPLAVEGLIRTRFEYASLLAAIGTPAPVPKPRGKSPGRVRGHKPAPRPSYPTVKKRAAKRKKSEQSPNHSVATAA